MSENCPISSDLSEDVRILSVQDKAILVYLKLSIKFVSPLSTPYISFVKRGLHRD